VDTCRSLAGTGQACDCGYPNVDSRASEIVRADDAWHSACDVVVIAANVESGPLDILVFGHERI